MTPPPWTIDDLAHQLSDGIDDPVGTRGSVLSPSSGSGWFYLDHPILALYVNVEGRPDGEPGTDIPVDPSWGETPLAYPYSDAWVDLWTWDGVHIATHRITHEWQWVFPVPFLTSGMTIGWRCPSPATIQINEVRA